MVNRFSQFVQQPTVDDPASQPPSTNRFSQFVTKSQPDTGGVSVPLYVPAADGGEIRIDDSNRAALEAQQKAQEEAKAKEQAAFDATRTPATRIRDAATFAASVPVRAVTQGDYGIGDAFGLVSKQAGQNAAQSEANFARANQSGLETAAAAGDVLMGVPMLSTMGAVPGEMLRTTTAAARQLPSDANRLMRDTSGAARVPGTPPPPPPAAAAVVPAFEAGRVPTRAETFAAADRLKGLSTPENPVQVDIPEMVAGKRWQQTFAAGLKSIPYAGDPIESMFEKGLKQMEGAKAAVGRNLGQAEGGAVTGEGLKRGAFDWISKGSKEIAGDLYGDAFKAVDPSITTPGARTAALVDRFKAQMQLSTGKAQQAAIGLVEDALARPEGLSAEGWKGLRTEIGDALTESQINKSPSAKALDGLYGAVTDDMKAAIKNAGGPEALRKWELANREFKIIAGKRERLSKLVGTTEDKLTDEAVYQKALSAMSEKGGNIKGLSLLMDTVGPETRGNFAAQLLDKMGIDSKTKLFSHDRMLSEWGKYSPEAKRVAFGDAAKHIDDIAAIATKFGTLSAKFNKSQTAIGTAVQKLMKFLMNPATLAVHGASAVVSPVFAASLAAQATGLQTARSFAWTLAKPSTAKQTSRVLRSYYKLSLPRQGVEAIARHEQELATAVRAYGVTIAKETGEKADDISSSLTAEIDKLRNQPQ